jgi:hypothetical protein
LPESASAIQLGRTTKFGCASQCGSTGEPRASNDVDIVLRLPIGRIGHLVKALGAEFEVDTDMLRDALANGRSCNIFHLPSVMKIDIFGLGDSPFDESEELLRRGLSDAGPYLP